MGEVVLLECVDGVLRGLIIRIRQVVYVIGLLLISLIGVKTDI